MTHARKKNPDLPWGWILGIGAAVVGVGVVLYERKASAAAAAATPAPSLDAKSQTIAAAMLPAIRKGDLVVILDHAASPDLFGALPVNTPASPQIPAGATASLASDFLSSGSVSQAATIAGAQALVIDGSTSQSELAQILAAVPQWVQAGGRIYLTNAMTDAGITTILNGYRDQGVNILAFKPQTDTSAAATVALLTAPAASIMDQVL